MSTKQRRAKSGGEIGANGEFYEGGKFINTVEKNGKKHKDSKKPTGRREIASGVWELPPQDGLRSIFRMLAGVEAPVFHGLSIVSFKFNPNLKGDYVTESEIIRRKMLIEKWNAGERWI